MKHKHNGSITYAPPKTPPVSFKRPRVNPPSVVQYSLYAYSSTALPRLCLPSHTPIGAGMTTIEIAGAGAGIDTIFESLIQGVRSEPVIMTAAGFQLAFWGLALAEKHGEYLR